MHAVLNHIAITQKQIFWALCSALLVTAMLYGYFVLATIGFIVDRKQAEQHIEERITQVSDLESRYSAASSRITQSYARSLGFVEPEEKTYAQHKRFVSAAQ